MNDFSIDNESLGVRWDAPVIAIGCQQFDCNTGKLGDTFYRVIDVNSALRSGRADGETIKWWMRQNDAARQLFQDQTSVSLATALEALATWMRGKGGAPRVWGNGATADITWLEHAYDTGCVGLKEAWHYTNIRDMRTLMEDAQFDPHSIPFVGVKHNALHDATHQAKAIAAARMKINAALKGKPEPVRVAEQFHQPDDEEL